MRPTQQSRDNKADTLARAGRRKAHDMLWPVMAQIAILQPADKHALRVEQTGFADFALGRPARRAVGRDQPGLARPPQRSGDRDDNAEHTATGRHRAGAVEDPRRVSLKGVPPLEQPPRDVNGITGDMEPGRTEPRLIAELGRRPLRREPDRANDDREDEEDLAYEESGRCHRSCAGVGAEGSGKFRQRIVTKSHVNQGNHFQCHPRTENRGNYSQMRRRLAKNIRPYFCNRKPL